MFRLNLKRPEKAPIQFLTRGSLRELNPRSNLSKLEMVGPGCSCHLERQSAWQQVSVRPNSRQSVINPIYPSTRNRIKRLINATHSKFAFSSTNFALFILLSE